MTLEGDIEGSDQLVEEIRATVAERIGKFARPKRIAGPTTCRRPGRGKIMRRLLRDIAEGRAPGDVTTCGTRRDPSSRAKSKEEQAAEG